MMLCEHMKKFATDYASGDVHVSAIDLDISGAEQIALWCDDAACHGAEATNAEWSAFLSASWPAAYPEVKAH